MNVEDFGQDVIPSDFSEKDMLDWIFARQHQLMDKYMPIEKQNGLLISEDCPVNIHDRFGQARLKDFFWRTLEELGEADEAFEKHGNTVTTHSLEELADALHFLVETYLLAGITPTKILAKLSLTGDVAEYDLDKDKLEALYSYRTPCFGFSSGCWGVARAIADASNFLKQRPWKQTHQLTDVTRFEDTLVHALPRLMNLFSFAGLGAKEVFTMYFKKSEVNKFRINSNY